MLRSDNGLLDFRWSPAWAVAPFIPRFPKPSSIATSEPIGDAAAPHNLLVSPDCRVQGDIVRTWLPDPPARGCGDPRGKGGRRFRPVHSRHDRGGSALEVRFGGAGLSPLRLPLPRSVTNPPVLCWFFRVRAIIRKGGVPQSIAFGAGLPRQKESALSPEVADFAGSVAALTGLFHHCISFAEPEDRTPADAPTGITVGPVRRICG